MDYKFTSKMEKNLDKIADGKKDKKDILIDFLKYLQEKEDIFKINKKEFKKEENIIGKIDDNDVNLLKINNFNDLPIFSVDYDQDRINGFEQTGTDLTSLDSAVEE